MKKLVSLLLALALCLGLGGAALATTATEDLFRPQAWFGDWADDYELINWDYYDDVGGLGLILGFRSEPVAAVQLFQAYADRLSEDVSLQEMSRKEYESAYGDYDQEACYTYLGSSNVGSVTSLLGGTPCELTVDQVWLEDGCPRIVIAWGEGFPLQIDLDGIDVLSADVEPVSDPSAPAAAETVSGPVIPDAWSFFNEEVTHDDEKIENGTQAVFSFGQDHAAAAYEYVDLLENGGFGLTLTGTLNEDRSKGGGYYNYYFDSDGLDEGLIDPAARGAPETCAVHVHINDWPDAGLCEVTIRFSEGLTVVDAGERCSVTGLVDLREYKSGPMGGEGPRTGDADYTMRVGESLQLDCPRRFGANTEQFRWAVDEGADLVSLEGEISASCTVTAKAPGRAVVSVVYDHSYDTTDILTGNDTYGFAAPTYYFIIEITN